MTVQRQLGAVDRADPGRQGRPGEPHGTANTVAVSETEGGEAELSGDLDQLFWARRAVP